MSIFDDKPWGRLGHEVKSDPIKDAQLDWEVHYLPQIVQMNGDNIRTGKYAYLGRNNMILSSDAAPDNPPLQNREAFLLFEEYIKTSGSKIVAAGTIKQDRTVWFLAETPHRFYLNRNGIDPVVGHVLFTNYHEPDRVPDARFMPIRMETFTSLTTEVIDEYKDHTIMPGLIENCVQKGMEFWKEKALRMDGVTYDETSLHAFLTKVLPLTGIGRNRAELSAPAQKVLTMMPIFPGANLSHGTWWQVYTALCYTIDYILGHGTSTRLDSSWYGLNQKRKVLALDLIERHIKELEKV